MTTDVERIVGRLRSAETTCNGLGELWNLCDEAADEIERLRAAHAELALYFTSRNEVPVERATIKAADFWKITGLPPNAQAQVRP